MVKIIRKTGGSYHVLLPKGKVEFFEWTNKPVIIDEFNNEHILIKKIQNVELKPKTK